MTKTKSTPLYERLNRDDEWIRPYQIANWLLQEKIEIPSQR